MADSLQDQLLRMGLVDEKRAKKAQKALRNERRQKQKQKKTHRGGGATAHGVDAERDRELNRKRQAAAEQKAIAAQVRQLIQQHRLPAEADGEAYHFTDGKKVKRIFISAGTRQRISNGQLWIVRLDGKYELVPSAIGEKIRQRDASAVITIEDEKKQVQDAADPYADFQIPDDLMW